jgi:hypothetical protein
MKMKKPIMSILVLLNLALIAGSPWAATTSFGPEQEVASIANGACSVIAADLDDDGDMDVVTTILDENQIVWYENDGTGGFGATQIITTSVDAPWQVHAADLDGDLDIDLLSASEVDNKIAWYQNDGNGNFGGQQIITLTGGNPWSVYAADLDKDGDLDVLSGSFSEFATWYENDGTGNFGPDLPILTSTAECSSVIAADLNGDGDLDVITASYSFDDVAWHENLDGLGDFGAQQIISTAVNTPRSLFAADLNGDTFIDVLSASEVDDKVAWYENLDGLGNFGTQQVITTNADAVHNVYAADLDGDGDLDVLSASYSATKLLGTKTMVRVVLVPSKR